MVMVGWGGQLRETRAARYKANLGCFVTGGALDLAAAVPREVQRVCQRVSCFDTTGILCSTSNSVTTALCRHALQLSSATLLVLFAISPPSVTPHREEHE